VFFGGFGFARFGLMLWGIGYATQDALLKVLIASVLPEGRRNFAFGVFYLGYGGEWLLGCLVTGLIYDRSRLAVVVFAVSCNSPRFRSFFLAREPRDADHGSNRVVENIITPNISRNRSRVGSLSQ
jgi:MFS family permease